MSAPKASNPLRFPLDGEGVWREVRRAPWPRPRAALFADRDGTVIELVPYLSDPAKAVLVSGAAQALARANRLGIPVVMVTNQSGIGRGYYGWAEFAAVQRAVDEALARAGAGLDGLYACPHPPRSVSGAASEPPCRKPNPGMLLKAARDLNLDLAASVIVGDALADIEAGKRAGLAKALLVATGYGARDRRAALALAEGAYAVQEGGFAALADTLEALASRRRAVEKRGRAC